MTSSDRPLPRFPPAGKWLPRGIRLWGVYARAVERSGRRVDGAFKDPDYARADRLVMQGLDLCVRLRKALEEAVERA